MCRNRLATYRKQKKWWVIAKMLAIFYIVIFTSSYFFSNTGAYFSDQETKEVKIKAGERWDHSDLEFTGKSTQNIKACPPVEVEVGIKNNGFSMVGPAEYELYYVKNGNPKNQGKKIAEDTIDPLETSESGKLSFQADKTGSYMFKAFQRPGYNDDDDERQAIWSEKVMVKCNKQQSKSAAGQNDHQIHSESSRKKGSNIDDNTKSEADKQHSKSANETKKHNKKEKSNEYKANEQEEIDKNGNKAADEPDREEKGSANTEEKPADEEEEDQSDE